MYIPYLTYQDYLSTIQDGQLNKQILDVINQGARASNSQRQFAESWAIDKVRGQLKSKFDLDFEITPTLPYNPKQKYFAGNRCVIDFSLWTKPDLTIEGSGYKANDCVINDGVGYITLNDNNSQTFVPSEWTAIGYQYDIYYIAFPINPANPNSTIFRLDIQNKKGTYIDGYYKPVSDVRPADIVWWADHTYTCLHETIVNLHSANIQLPSTKDIPHPNVFPNDPFNGTQFWSDGGEFSFTGEFPFSDSTVWTLADNRNPTILKVIIDLAVWMLHSRISPNNIPKLREDNKNYSFECLRNLKKGDEDSDVEIIQPSQGMSIRWGSNPKVQNRMI